MPTYSWLRSIFEPVPPVVNGLALGLFGLTGVWGRIGARNDIEPVPVIVACLIAALLLQLSYVGKVIVCPAAFLKDFSQLPTVTALAPYPMGVSVFGKLTFEFIDEEIGLAVVVVATFLHVVCMLRFFQLVWKDRALPEPSWFAPTVGFSVPIMSGHACGWDPRISWVGFSIVLFLAVVLVPVVSVRVAFWNRWKVAPNPSCNLMMGPVSLTTMLWHVIGRPWSNNFGIFLFVMSTTIMIQTAFALVVRRHVWLHEPFTPAWAAFTFPLGAAASAAQLTWKFFAPESAAFMHYVHALEIWLNIVVGFVLISFLIKFVHWLEGVKTVLPQTQTVQGVDLEVFTNESNAIDQINAIQ